MWSLGWIGGPVVDSFGPRETAYVHRNMLTMLRATPVWARDAHKSVQNGLIAWTNEMVDLIRGVHAKSSCQNFPNRGIRDWKQQYYGENYTRLANVKTRYDPPQPLPQPSEHPTAPPVTVGVRTAMATLVRCPPGAAWDSESANGGRIHAATPRRRITNLR